MSKKTQKKTLKKTLKKPSKAAPRAAPKKAAAKKPPAKIAKPAGKTGKRPAAKAANRDASQVAKAQRQKAAPAPKVAAPKIAKPSANLSTSRAESPATAHTGLAEGAKAPAFRLPRDGGTTVSLSDFAGQKLVLFFYPRADTPGCTREAIDFTRLAKAFAESRTAVVGVSADSPKAQEAFRNKHELAVPLVSDEQHQMLEAYGVWGEKSMYGRTFLGISRTTVLIGSDSRIIRIWRNVKVDGHAEDVLAEAQNG